MTTGRWTYPESRSPSGSRTRPIDSSVMLIFEMMYEYIYLHDLKTTATQNRPDCCQSRATEKPGAGDELDTFLIQGAVC
jgi:hypothetical protein